MGIVEIISVGIGLSMDAVAVAMTNGMFHQVHGRLKMCLMPVFFGAFQGIMPCLGYFFGGMFAQLIQTYAGPAVLVILGTTGIRMLNSGLKAREECVPDRLTYKMLTLQALMTSIDAFAVGVGMSVIGADIFDAAAVIGVTTFICTCAATLIGKTCGDMLGKKAEILGGVILIATAVKAAF